LLVPVCPRSGRLAPYVHCYNYTYTWETGLPGHPRCFWETGHYSLASVGSGCLVVVGYCDVICGCDVYRQSVSVEDAGSEQYGKTLSDYDKFDSEMSVVSAIWNDCKRLIEAYNEKQVSQSCRLSSPVPLSVVVGPAVCRRQSCCLSLSVLLSVYTQAFLVLHKAIVTTKHK